MTKRTCAACDGELGDNPIQAKIRGKVCCKDCATKLKEADGFARLSASLRIARRNFMLGAGTAVAAGLALTAPAAGRDDMSQQGNATRKASAVRTSDAIAGSGDSNLINVCIGPLCGLKSDISRSQRSAISRHQRGPSFDHLVGAGE